MNSPKVSIIVPIYNVEKYLATCIKSLQNQSLKDLEIKGNDIISLGVPEGKVVGDVLRYVLEAVINGELPNSKEKLMCAVRQYLEVHGFEFKK